LDIFNAERNLSAQANLPASRALSDGVSHTTEPVDILLVFSLRKSGRISMPPAFVVLHHTLAASDRLGYFAGNFPIKVGNSRPLWVNASTQWQISR
jgi:hypothetical protein